MSVRIRLGTHWASTEEGSVQVREELGHDAKATASVAATQVVGRPAEYSSDVEIALPDGAERLFRGDVIEATVLDGTVVLKLASGSFLDEYLIDRLQVGAGMSPNEMVWSLARMAGLPPESIVLDAFDPPRDSFRVVMPVRGVALDSDLTYGAVRLTADSAAVRSLLDFTDESRSEDFLAAGVWATVRIDATTVFDAEQAGIALLDGTIDRLAVEARYSLAWAPNGAVLPFHRDGLFAHPRAERLVVVRGLSLPRAWLHSVSQQVRSLPMKRSRVTLAGPPVGENPQFDEAVRAWRRAGETTDSMAAVSALWEAIEFYAATARVRALFTGAQVAAIRRGLPEALVQLNLAADQARRLDERLGQLNDAPLLARLRSQLARDGVPFSSEELEGLRRLRKQRNDFLHGRGRGSPADNDLRLGKAIVNRILVFWAHAIDAGVRG